MCRTIAGGLDRSTLARVAGARLRDLVPPLAGRDGPVGGTYPARLRALLERHGATTWRTFGDLTLGQIAGWPGVGAITVASIVGVALDAAFDDVSGGAANGQPLEPMPSVGDDVAVLVGHELEAGTQVLRLAVEGFVTAEHPPAVRAAAGRLLAGPLADQADLRLAALDALLDEAGDVRTRGVFEHRSLRLDDQATSVELASALGVSQEWIRQLRARGSDRVRSAFAASTSTLGHTVTTVADRLGVAAPVAAVEALLASLDLPPSQDSRALLVLWLAGPYRPVRDRPGWLATDPAALLAETSRLLHEDGGVREAEHISKELEMIGVAPEHVGAWVADQPARLVDALVVATSGAPLDVAERALSATGRALTVDALSTWAGVPVGHGAGELWTLLRRDQRFVRVGADTFELAEWGGTPYEDAPDGGRLVLRVEVDADVLSGSGAPVPVDLVQGLGLRSGARRTFATRYGPVALSYDRPPTRGSLRPVALAAGAAVGDSVLLGFHLDDDAAMVEVIPPTAAVGPTA
ncbi:MAG: hypothetical protein M3503_00765 [Actinomycetota bacterium]|nr:hypothetical protein [Actinomycetota bacterium]